MLFSYHVDLETDEDGRVVADFPDLQGCSTDGADRAEALNEATDALEVWLRYAASHGEEIPAPGPAKGRPVVSADAVTSAKVALRVAMREAGVSNTELGRQMDVAETEVRRMLDFKHRSKIGRLEQALAVLGRRVVLMVEAA
ncbi:MAG: type II toxin-antitoxin system HicB family antitoxin [Alphaproteobacteria bacterium]|nr:type II toxin-antitoxin system HicB family antitoxin [Alphaproteobacteria bacterium]